MESIKHIHKDVVITRSNDGELVVTSRTVFKNITESKINVIKNELDGLTRTEWKYIRDGIDMYFRYKAANIKIDDHVCLDNYLNRKY